MPRELRSAEEIRAEVHRLIHQVHEVVEDKVKIRVPEPMRLGEPDGTGCNWTMMYFGNADGHQQACAAGVLQVQQKWNLSDG